jgi:Spy/CpxP family protein refolding chaperone
VVISAKLKGGLVLVGVFLLGGLAGGATARAWVQRDYAAQLTGRPGERIARRHLGALARELNLSDEQRERVRAIMDKHRSEREAVMKKLAESCGAPMREHKAKVDAEIRAVLDPEQRKRFDALLTKQRERFPLVGSPPFGPESGPGAAQGQAPPRQRAPFREAGWRGLGRRGRPAPARDAPL